MADRKIVWIMICTLISNSAYALIAPFLPLEFKKVHISGEIIGLMFAIYSVAVIVASPVVGKAVHSFGRANMISLGIFTMGLAFVLFGFIPKIDSKTVIITVGFALRFLQGASSSFVQTTCYSIATNDFPEKKEQIVGWVEALTGVGLIMGPILGSTLYSLLGYANTFFIYGSFLVLLSLVIKCMFPDGRSAGTEDDFMAVSNDAVD